MGDDRNAWEELYSKHPRAWRGSSRVPDLDLPAGSRVLDVGCGNGKTSVTLIEMGFNVTGTDFSENAVGYCREHFGEGAEFIVSDCTDMPFSDGLFDGIFAVHLAEHLDDEGLKGFASECFRILRPGGRLFVRSFSPDDMRAEGDESIRNGISYRYRRPEEIARSFSCFANGGMSVVEEKTRFGKIRSRSECFFTKSE